MNNPRRKPQHGFILVTSLIFLLVITLLALSTMNSAALQEKMAGNAREKARAREAADAALRDGEARLAQIVDYPAVDANHVYDPTPAVANDPGNNLTWRLWRENEPIGGAGADPDKAFLDSAPWTHEGNSVNNGAGGQAQATPCRYTAAYADLAQPPQFYIEQLGNFRPNDLNPDTRARARGQVLYRITARASGGKPSALAVTQSVYLKRY